MKTTQDLEGDESSKTTEEEEQDFFLIYIYIM